MKECFWSVAAVLIVWLGSLSAQESVPPFVHGPHDRLYILVKDETGAPRLLNGEPQYEAEVEVEGGRRLKVSATLSEIERAKARLNVQGLALSPWAEKSFEVAVDGTFLAKLINDFRDQPASLDSLLQGMPLAKAALIRSLLFSDRIILEEPVRVGSQDKNSEGFIDLHSLRVSAENPHPSPITIPVEIEDPPLWWEYIMRWFIEIELRHLSFEIESKEVRFDPLTNSIVFRVGCRGARVAGPTKDVGKIRIVDRYGFWRYHDENYLVRGDVGPLDLEIRFQFFKDTQGRWRLELLESEAIEAVQLIPRQIDNPSVEMEFRDPVKDRETGKPTNVQPVPLTPLALQVVNRTLGSTLESALGTIFYPEDLGDRTPIKNPWDHLAENETFLEWRLNDLRMSETALLAQFDSRVLVKKPAKCVESFLAVWGETIPLETTQGLVPLDRTHIRSWSLRALSGGAWSASTPGREQVGVVLSPSFLELLTKASMMAGIFCPQTRWLWPRDGSLPPLEFALTKVPEVRLNKGAIDLAIQGQAVLFGIQNDLIPRFEVSRQLDLAWNAQLKVDSESHRLKLGPLNALDLRTMARQSDPQAHLNPVSWSRDEVDFVLEMIEGAFEGFKVLGQNQLQWSWKDFGYVSENNPWWRWSLARADVEEGSIQLWIERRLASPSEDGDPSPRFVRSIERPVTQFDPALSSVVRESVTSISWTSQVPEAYYSWRYRLRGSFDWSPWSNFAQSRSVNLSTSQSGLYDVEVIAMNSFFEMEDFPKRLEFRVLLSPPRARTESQWKEANPEDQSMETPKSFADSKKVKAREPSKGPFGCQLIGEGAPPAPSGWFWSLVGAGGAVGVLLRRRRKLLCRFERPRRSL